MKIIILDGYVDEPSCLGVPPYISSYVRYTAGAISDAGFEPIYITIDEYRRGSPKIKSLSKANFLVIIGGAIVPGKYLGGNPASILEIKKIAENFKGNITNRCFFKLKVYSFNEEMLTIMFFILFLRKTQMPLYMIFLCINPQTTG